MKGKISKMKLYPEAINDDRIRQYLPTAAVVAESGSNGSEYLIGNREPAIFLWGDIPTCKIAPGGWVLLDFGIELHGGVRLVNCDAAKIRLRFGESVSEAMQTPNQDHAIHDAELALPQCGAIEYGNTAFRFVRIDSLENKNDIVLQNVMAVALYRDLEWVGNFNSSDERLNRIWKTGAYTVQLCMQEYVFDGAKRDRLPWIGDLHPEMCTILSVFSDTSLLQKTLDFVRDRTPEGSFCNATPSYSLWFIICHWEYYLHTGNLAYLAEQKEYIRELLQRFSGMLAEDGSEAIVEWRFLDWPSCSDPAGVHAGLHGLLYWAFSCGIKILEALGEDTVSCRNVMLKMSKIIPDCGNNKSAAALLSLSGLADMSAILHQNPLSGISTFFGGYVLNAQPTDTALEVIRRYWGGMLDYGATTFWEDFDLAWLENTSPITELPQPGKKDLHADFGNYCYKGLRHSFCHGWASGPTSFLSRRVLGVKFLTPGGSKISVKPDFGDLEYISGSVPTPHGKISITAEKGGKLSIDSPTGVEIIQP